MNLKSMKASLSEVHHLIADEPKLIQRLIEASAIASGMNDGLLADDQLGNLKRKDIARFLNAQSQLILKSFEAMQRLHALSEAFENIPDKVAYDGEIMGALNGIWMQAQNLERVVSSVVREADETHEFGISAELKAWEKSDKLHAEARRIRRDRRVARAAF